MEQSLTVLLEYFVYRDTLDAVLYRDAHFQFDMYRKSLRLTSIWMKQGFTKENCVNV